MKKLWSIGAWILIVLAGSSPSVAQSSSSLISRMVRLNPGLHSYTAHLTSNVNIINIPFMHPQLEGMIYHKHPSLNKIVITSGLPGIAKQFSRIYPQVPSPSQWDALYAISITRDDGVKATLRLVPRKHGRVDHIDVLVNDVDATVAQMRWNYVDGGYANLNQTFAVLDGHHVVVKQSGHVEVALYKADIETTLSGYVWNPSIPNGFFASVEN